MRSCHPEVNSEPLTLKLLLQRTRVVVQVNADVSVSVIDIVSMICPADPEIRPGVSSVTWRMEAEL